MVARIPGRLIVTDPLALSESRIGHILGHVDTFLAASLA